MKALTTHKKGLTLVEVLITVLIVTFMMIAIFNMYMGFMTSFSIQQAYIDIAGSANSVVSAVDTTARQADAIVSSHTFSGTAYTTGSTTVIFELPSINSTGDIISSTHDYVGIYATGTSAYRILELGAGSARAFGSTHLSDKVKNMTLTYDNASPSSASKIDVDITTGTTIRNQALQSHLHQQSYMRNK